MTPEYEARFLAIDTHKVATALRTLGAELHQERTLMRRVVFKNNDIAQHNGWLRLRDEGRHVTLTYKQATAPQATIDSTLEAEITVSSFEDTYRLLTAVHFTALHVQENYREEWRLGELRFDLDTWPGLPTFLEIEGPDAMAVQRAAHQLGLTMAGARFGSIDEVYQTEVGRDILAEPNLLFAVDPFAAP
jgi:adenylate cyclase class 2